MPDSLSPIDYLVVGHITRDLLPAGRSAVGGTAAYAALTASSAAVLLTVAPDIMSTSVGWKGGFCPTNCCVNAASRTRPPTSAA